MELTCTDVCEALCDAMCRKCQYFQACQMLDPDDGGMSESDTHEQMIECIGNGFKPIDWDKGKEQS